MATYMQADRWMTVTTPLGPDDLLLVGFAGHEAVSQLFSFQLDLLAENQTVIPFEQLLGQKMTVNLTLPESPTTKRHFSGICVRLTQSAQDNTFTSYRAEVVPELWLLSKKAQSRIFQQLTVPEILKQVLAGLDVSYQLSGTYNSRDYCVQYRETDFNFASRLMEEEGIYYYFEHQANTHRLIVADTPANQPDLPDPSTIIYDGTIGGTRAEDRIRDWAKTQELRSGKYTLWDHCFELPHQHLEAVQNIQASVAVGQVSHQLHVGNNDKLELYDYPGEYAQRYDGVDPGGGDRPADLQHIFHDNTRTVGIRMQEEAAPGLVIHGASNCRHFMSGYAFTLQPAFQRRRQIPADRRPARRAAAGRLPLGRPGRLPLVRQPVHLHPLRPPLPPQAVDPQAVRPGDADGGRGRPARRGDLHRQVRAGEGPVPLGPPGPEQRQQLVLDPGRGPLGGQPVGHHPHPAHRPGGHRRLRGGRPGPADHHRVRLQRQDDAALQAARVQDEERHQVAQHPGGRPRRGQRADLRGPEGVGRRLFLRPEGLLTASSRTMTTCRWATLRRSASRTASRWWPGRRTPRASRTGTGAAPGSGRPGAGGGAVGLTKGTIELDAGESITLKVGEFEHHDHPGRHLDHRTLDHDRDHGHDDGHHD